MDSTIFASWVFICIVGAGLIVGIQTYPNFANNSVLDALDILVLSTFALEIVLKIIGEEFTPLKYFTNHNWKWNWFDLIIVIASLPYGSNQGTLKLVKIVRLLRLIKLFRKIDELNLIMTGLLMSMKFVSYIVLLWTLVMYIFGITGMLLFGANDPFHFLTIDVAIFTLFQVTVMDVRYYVLLLKIIIYMYTYVYLYSFGVK